MKSYNKFYYENNKGQILITKRIKRINEYRDLAGHIKAIHDAIRRYAKKWHLEIDSLKIFKRWSLNESAYEELFNDWKAADFSKGLTPVVMRNVKKEGFKVINLYWSVKQAHDWWSGILDTLQEQTKVMEERQKKNNPMTEEETQERIASLKAKRKSK